MPAIVSSVEEGSIAEELEIAEGDEILSIDDNQLRDLIDFNFYSKTEEMTICIKKANGDIEEIELEKDFDEDLGIIFESAIFDKIKPCCNRCLFCFVDQQPKGLRDTLYIKDDDYRLSYLQGSYVTLSNLKDADKERISKMKLGPLYVSVHTTNPELRAKMLRNPNASKIMEQLKWLKSQDIPFHVQIVLCPGYNDGDELERTLEDLKTLKKSVMSVAIVPVGITHFREETNGLVSVTPEVAKKTIELTYKYKNVCCSDEFFLIADYDIPPAKYYGNYCQLGDGVGSLRVLLDEFHSFKLPKKIKEKKTILFATSVAAKKAFEEISRTLNEKVENLTAKFVPVQSNYWGEKITVAGLITSEDLISAVKDIETDVVIIPSIMLKAYSETFLDGNTLDYVKEKSKKNFFVTKNPYSTEEIIEYIKTL